MANADSLDKSRASRVIADIVSNIADGDNTGHAGRDLVECDTMRVRMEPEKPRRMVGQYFDLIVRGIEFHDAMNVRTNDGRAIGRSERQHEDIVTIGWVGRRRIMRRYQHPMSVNVGRIECQECLVWILRMGGVGDRWQLFTR